MKGIYHLKVLKYCICIETAWLNVGVLGVLVNKFARFTYPISLRETSDLCLLGLLYLSKQGILYTPWKYSVPLLTLLYLWMHIKCWVELILWGNDAAGRSITWMNYNGIQSGNRCSADIAYYHYHFHRRHCSWSKILIQIRPQCLESLPELQFTWASGCG